MPLTIWVWTKYFWPDAQWVMPGRSHFGSDFVNFWSGGRFAANGMVATAYDVAAYKAQLREWFAPAIHFTNFSYPPSLLLWLTPFAALPFLWSFTLWSLLGIAAFLYAVLHRRPTLADTCLIVLLLVSPILISNILFGQITLFAALAYIAAMRLLPTHPAWAGVCIGLLSLKPQLGLLIPFFLLAIGAWTTIATAAATTLVLASLSITLFGTGPWHTYLTDTAAVQWSYILTMDGFYAYHMTTPYAGFWVLGFPVRTALALHAAIAAVIVLATISVARSACTWPLKSTLLGFGMVMLMPYSLAHDLALPLVALLWHLRSETRPLTTIEQWGTTLLWMLPFPLAFVLPMAGIPATSFALIAAYVLLLKRAAEQDPRIFTLPTWSHRPA